jgi:hypothetical protein
MRTAIFLLATFSSVVISQIDFIDSNTQSAAETWDYKKHGSDWTIGSCQDKSYSLSPQYLYKEEKDGAAKGVVQDWAKDGQFEFLPGYKKAKTMFQGLDEHNVFTLNVTHDDQFGYLSFSEPVNTTTLHQVRMNATMVRFHTPAEHQIEGQDPYDMEMQIYHNVSDLIMSERAFHCSSHQAVVSLLFRVSKTPNPLFDFQTKYDAKTPVELDLSTVLTPHFSVLHDLLGYVGSDTRPPCTVRFCWIVVDHAFEAT